MKTILGILIGLLVFISCNSRKIDEKGGWDITIHGKINFPQSGAITLREYTSDNAAKADTIKLGSTGVYEKKIHLVQPGFYQLNFFNQQIVNLILGKSNIEVNVDGNNMQGFSEIKGSAEHDLINQVQAIMTSIQNAPELAALEKQYNEERDKHDEVKMEALRAQYMAFLKTGHDKIATLLLQQPGSLGLLNLLMQGNVLDRDEYGNVYEDAAQKLKKELPDLQLAKEFVVQIEMARKIAIGSVAPEIALPNPKGDTIKLSSLRGKYVLVDFWAKWCGPCRGENPNVVAAYHKFKSKGFEVYGVSLDRNKTDWMQAIEQDGLVWTQVSDLAYFNSTAAKLYNINAIPFSLLLDPKGIIIAKNLRGAALQRKLTEVFGK